MVKGFRFTGIILPSIGKTRMEVTLLQKIRADGKSVPGAILLGRDYNALACSLPSAVECPR